MSDLTNGVDPGIGAAGASQADRVIGNLGQRSLQTGLHGSYSRRLRLPATKPDAVVLDAQRHAHRPKFSPSQRKSPDRSGRGMAFIHGKRL